MIGYGPLYDVRIYAFFLSFHVSSFAGSEDRRNGRERKVERTTAKTKKSIKRKKMAQVVCDFQDMSATIAITEKVRHHSDFFRSVLTDGSFVEVINLTRYKHCLVKSLCDYMETGKFHVGEMATLDIVEMLEACEYLALVGIKPPRVVLGDIVNLADFIEDCTFTGDIVVLPEQVFVNCVFENTRLSSTGYYLELKNSHRFVNCDFDRCSIRYLKNARFENCRFDGCNVSCSRMVSLDGCSFEKCVLDGITYRDVNGCKFSRCSLRCFELSCDSGTETPNIENVFVICDLSGARMHNFFSCRSSGCLLLFATFTGGDWDPSPTLLK